ncbi:hypothetical protein FB45DRAFT_869347 [Roridomyces roridus]|uniref:Uncharacterized protein n=1 Tax=Roridomyces roridus TaxID=1738132 RepID=A0AAD7FKH0_9AGAR|nr:hypothetical protein FB45DRAFT_869347 [Roridomyces roridus]
MVWMLGIVTVTERRLVWFNDDSERISRSTGSRKEQSVKNGQRRAAYRALTLAGNQRGISNSAPILTLVSWNYPHHPTIAPTLFASCIFGVEHIQQLSCLLMFEPVARNLQAPTSQAAAHTALLHTVNGNAKPHVFISRMLTRVLPPYLPTSVDVWRLERYRADLPIIELHFLVLFVPLDSPLRRFEMQSRSRKSLTSHSRRDRLSSSRRDGSASGACYLTNPLLLVRSQTDSFVDQVVAFLTRKHWFNVWIISGACRELTMWGVPIVNYMRLTLLRPAGE